MARVDVRLLTLPVTPLAHADAYVVQMEDFSTKPSFCALAFLLN